MTNATQTLLRYLRAYVDEKTGRRAELQKFFEQKVGKPLNDGNLSRHLNLKHIMDADTTLVYIGFLRDAGELLPGPKGGPVFTYKRLRKLLKK